jgi:hypothetical protein
MTFRRVGAMDTCEARTQGARSAVRARLRTLHRARPVRAVGRGFTVKRAASLLLVALVALSVGCGSSNGGSGAAGATGKAAPAFSGATMSGSPVSLQSYQGKPLALIFWASW